MDKFNLNEEIICGHKVTSKMKKVWKIQLEMLKKFIQVCNKYNLKYFLCAGSLLGAIRHNGYIPWDDDIDIGMLREDYDKLLEIADKEFKKPLFFQTTYNDKVFRGHAQIRKDNTAAIIKSDIYMKYHQGIFIDIFPFDEYPKYKIQQKFQKCKITILKKIMVNYFNPRKISKKSKILSLFSRSIIENIGINKVFKYYERICSKYNDKGNGKIFCLSFMYLDEKFQYDKSLFDDLIIHKFEYLDVMIPKEFDILLKMRYGNYKKNVKNGSLHGKIIFDVENSYKKICKDIIDNQKK